MYFFFIPHIVPCRRRWPSTFARGKEQSGQVRNVKRPCWLWKWDNKNSFYIFTKIPFFFFYSLTSTCCQLITCNTSIICVARKKNPFNIGMQVTCLYISFPVVGLKSNFSNAVNPTTCPIVRLAISNFNNFLLLERPPTTTCDDCCWYRDKLIALFPPFFSIS